LGLRLVNDEFQSLAVPTICIGFFKYDIPVDNFIVPLTIWDTAGQEKYRSLARPYYRGSSGAIIAYSLENATSLRNAAYWLKDVKDFVSDELPIVLVATKSDLNISNSTQLQEQGNQFAKENNIKFVVSSAKLGTGVKDAFEELARMIIVQKKTY